MPKGPEADGGATDFLVDFLKIVMKIKFKIKIFFVT